MTRLSATLTRLAAIAALAALTGLAIAQAAPAESIPATLTPPPGSVLLFELQARGVQIYACESNPDNHYVFAWKFKGPEAELLNQQG